MDKQPWSLCQCLILDSTLYDGYLCISPVSPPTFITYLYTTGVYIPDIYLIYT